MSLLDDFSRFSAISSVHAFPKMRLMARDHEPDLVAGSGELRVVSANRFEFTLIGEPENPAYVFEQMRRQQDDRYDGLSRFRLVLEEDDGTAYAGGWSPRSGAKDRDERLSCFARKAVRPGMKVAKAVAPADRASVRSASSRGRAGWREKDARRWPPP